MLGWQIFMHALRMVFGNIKQALQITTGPALVATALIVVSFLMLDIPLDDLGTQTGQNPSDLPYGSIILFACIVVLVAGVTMFWIAVSWHRFVLLAEYPRGIFPTFRFDRILAYFGRGFLLGLLMGVAFMPISMLVSATTGGGAFTAALLVVYVLFLVVCFYRLSIILPAAAIGTPLSISGAWSNTEGTTGTIFVLLIVNFLFQFLVQMVFALLAIIPVLGVLLTVLFSILVLPLINVSLLTTMYGVFVEKRDLD